MKWKMMFINLSWLTISLCESPLTLAMKDGKELYLLSQYFMFNNEWGVFITLFRFITMLREYDYGEYTRILSVPQNTVTDHNNVMFVHLSCYQIFGLVFHGIRYVV